MKQADVQQRELSLSVTIGCIILLECQYRRSQGVLAAFCLHTVSMSCSPYTAKVDEQGMFVSTEYILHSQCRLQSIDVSYQAFDTSQSTASGTCMQ